MKIFDCFLFNNEFDLLNLRLHFLSETVDYFVLVESERTLAGQSKPLYFKNNQHLYTSFKGKIIHLVAPVNNLPAWEYEFFERNYMKHGLKDASENDIVFISDVDEIVNVREIITNHQHKLPALIELPMYYYYFNLRTNATFSVNLAGSWSFIKDLDLGFRTRDYSKYTHSIIGCNHPTGWHFSYMFGTHVERYKNKIASFSHQEYNTPYYVNPGRILKCITLGIDLFERNFMKLYYSSAGLQPIMPIITKLNLDAFIYKPQLINYIRPNNLFFLGRISAKKLKAQLISFFIKTIVHIRK